MDSRPELSGPELLLLGAVAVFAAVFDIRSRRVPNWLALAAAVAGVVWNSYSAGLTGLGRSAAGLGVGFVLYFPLWLLRARGAGDVKLLAAMGSITGPANCFLIFLLTALLGGIVAVVYVTFRGRLRRTLFNVGCILRDLAHLRAPYRSDPELDVTSPAGMRLPHAVLMATGVLALIALAKA